MPNTSANSVTSFFAITFACWIWPLFQWLVIELLWTAGYSLNLGGSLMSLLACALSVIAAVALSFPLYFSMRTGYAPLNRRKGIVCFFIVVVAASTLVNGFLLSMGMFCKIGGMPDPELTGRAWAG